MVNERDYAYLLFLLDSITATATVKVGTESATLLLFDTAGQVIQH